MVHIRRASVRAFFAAYALTLISSASAAWATNYYLSPTGDDANDCKTVATACKTLARGVVVLKLPGDRLSLAGGTYRQGALTVNFTANGTFQKGISINGSTAAGNPSIISGLKPLTGWQPDPNYPNVYRTTPSPTKKTVFGNTVYVAQKYLRSDLYNPDPAAFVARSPGLGIGSSCNLQSGYSYFDGTTVCVRLEDDSTPVGKLVEITASDVPILKVTGDFVTVKGITFVGNDGPLQMPGTVEVSGASQFNLLNSTIAGTTVALGLDNAYIPTISGSTFLNNTQHIHAFGTVYPQVTLSTFLHANWQLGKQADTGFEYGTKFSGTDAAVIQQNTFSDNYGIDLWFDNGSGSGAFSSAYGIAPDNLIQFNKITFGRIGLVCEISYRCRVYNNVVSGQTLQNYGIYSGIDNSSDGSGISISSSADVDVWNNSVACIDAQAINVTSQDVAPYRDDAQGHTVNVFGLSLINNAQYKNCAGLGNQNPGNPYSQILTLPTAADLGNPVVPFGPNTASHEGLYFPGNAAVFATIAGVNYNSCAAIGSVIPGLVCSNQQLDATTFKPKQNSPLINAGVDDGLPQAYDLTQRPQDGLYDISAYEVKKLTP